MRRSRLALALLLSCGLWLPSLGCGNFGAENEDEQAPPIERVDAQGRVVLSAEEVAALALETEVARVGAATPEERRFGVVVAPPDQDLRLTAPVDGRLIAVAVTLGQRVEVGDPIATLVPLADTSSQADLSSQRAEVHARILGGRARVTAAEAELERVSRLVEVNLATTAQRAQAEAALTAERTQVEGLVRAERTLRGFTGGSLPFHATSPGVVAQVETRVGSFVRQGELLARVLGAGPRWIDLDVPTDEATGDSYRVHAGDVDVDAHLLARGALASGSTRVDRLEVGAEQTLTLLPGRRVAVSVVHPARGVVVPVGAIVRQGDGRLCFVEQSAGVYEARRVSPGVSDGTVTVIEHGLSAGERVVVQGAASLLGELGFSGHVAAAPEAPTTMSPAGRGRDGSGH